MISQFLPDVNQFFSCYRAPMLPGYFIYPAEQVSGAYRIRVRVRYGTGTYRVRHMTYWTQSNTFCIKYFNLYDNKIINSDNKNSQQCQMTSRTSRRIDLQQDDQQNNPMFLPILAYLSMVSTHQNIQK
jgi:hypothetical protein